MEVQKMEIDVDSKKAVKKLEKLAELTQTYIAEIEKLNNIELTVNVIQKIPKKWYQFWISNT